METLPFASKPAPYSVWGCTDTSSKTNQKQAPSFYAPRSNGHPTQTQNMESSSETSCPSTNYEYMPAVLLNSLKRDKKPFTYTPGRVDLSEVLNDKLRQRMERRKKRAEERAYQPSPIEELPTFEPPKQVLVMPTYNSPLNMYSMENALEALEVQAELTVGDKSLSTPPSRSHSMTLPRNYKYEPVDFEPKNVTQSKAFRVLQIITDTEEEEGIKGYESNAESYRDEMKFRSTRPSDAIPSKLFHNLQRITETEGKEPSKAPLQPRSGLEDNTERYQDEMRFSGTRPNKVIPSKLFHNLQRITGTAEEEEEEERSTNVTNRKSPGPVSAPNPGVRDIVFRPKDNMMQQVKNTLQTNQFIRKGEKEPSIPFLQRPAAFLPTKQVSCPRFNVMNMSNSHANNIHYSVAGGTDL